MSDREQSSVCACVWGITIKRMREYRCLGLRDKHSCLGLWQLLMLSQTLIGCEFERQPGGWGDWERDTGSEWERESETRSWKRGSNGPPLWNLPVLDNIWLNFPMWTSSWHAAIWERETERERVRGMKTSRKKKYWLQRFTSIRSSRRGGPV